MFQRLMTECILAHLRLALFPAMDSLCKGLRLLLPSWSEGCREASVRNGREMVCTTWMFPKIGVGPPNHPF